MRWNREKKQMKRVKPVLEVRDLTVRFTQRDTAVDGVSFQLYPGEILGIAGESGSGKSTVARAVTRLIDVASGEIFLKGAPITHVTGKRQRAVYRDIQMVFQSPACSFDPRKTLGDGIGESLGNTGMKRSEVRERVGELLRQCGLGEEFAGKYAREVSGGQCQRAAIARALAVRPDILVCDEAVNALDVTVQKQIIEVLKDLQQEYGMSYLFISHDLALMQSFCDRLLIMQKGKIVEEGTADEVILHPKKEYTKRLMEAAFLFG